MMKVSKYINAYPKDEIRLVPMKPSFINSKRIKYRIEAIDFNKYGSWIIAWGDNEEELKIWADLNLEVPLK